MTNPNDRFTYTPEQLESVPKFEGRILSFQELWHLKNNRPDKITDEEWYGHCLGHIMRILALWEKGMSARVGLLAILKCIMDEENEGNEFIIIDGLIQHEVAKAEGNHVDAMIALDQVINASKNLEALHSEVYEKEQTNDQD